MEFRDRPTGDAVTEIARLLAIAYQRYRRGRRIEIADPHRPDSVNGEPGDPCLEILQVKEANAW